MYTESVVKLLEMIVAQSFCHCGLVFRELHYKHTLLTPVWLSEFAEAVNTSSLFPRSA
jgi:hypothetical protein